MIIGNTYSGLTIGQTFGGLTFDCRCCECGRPSPAGWERCTFHTTMHRLEELEKKTEERNEQADREYDRASKSWGP